MNEYAIQASHLCKKYKYKMAIDDFSVSIPANELLGIVGKNGAGKTTFMRLCAGLLDITGGSLNISGESPMDNLNVLSNLVYACHDMNYDNGLKLKAILQNYQTMFQTFDKAFAEKLLRYFDLDSNLKYENLSQGMASTFNFICGISCRAKITMFDEPVSGMDAGVRKAVYEILLQDYNHYPRTILVSSHLLSELEGILSGLILIDNGKLILHKSMDDLRQSAYSVEGGENDLTAFCKGRKIIYRKRRELSSFAIVEEPLDETAMQQAKHNNLRLSAVRPEELCIYLVQKDKGDSLECLYQ